jgi:recombination protein RecT
MSTEAISKPQSQPNRLDTLRTQLEQAQSKLAAVMPKYMTSERLIRLMLSACSRNPKILECSPASVLLFTMRCAETGLEPVGAGGAWMIPFENRKNNTVELQFIPDYRGLISLAKRNGDVHNVTAFAVYDKDAFELEYGMDFKLVHKPCLTGDKGKLRGVYAVVTTKDGEKNVQWMDLQDIEGIRKRSKAGNYGPWQTDYEAMALKTVIRRALKFFQSSPQLQAALEYDNEAAGLDEAAKAKPVIELPPEPTAKPAVESPASEPEPPVTQAEDEAKVDANLKTAWDRATLDERFVAAGDNTLEAVMQANAVEKLEIIASLSKQRMERPTPGEQPELPKSPRKSRG